ncbi:hypothetical protein AAFF_G00155740 [Aldrovandia affinis]|uniref:Galectin n=1 Tax=Aldrovandia affinis TaxID=143900 RepID=A0AAD7T226_9TELE|nr:hypothetical protein AAFF_G00155740 [Aldrovandia affinis]
MGFLVTREELYVGEIKGGLKPAMRLVVMGIVKQQPKRWNSKPAGVSVSLLVVFGCLTTWTGPNSAGGLQSEKEWEEENVRRSYSDGVGPYTNMITFQHWEKIKIGMVVAVVCHPENETETDVGLQVAINFQDRAVLRNARMGGKWGVSESALSYFPFAAGESFPLAFHRRQCGIMMEIVCEHQQFRILVDGQPLCGFTHRITQLASLTTLHICGDLQLTKVA